MATSHSKEAGRLDPVDNGFTIPYNDCLIGFGELAMAHYFLSNAIEYFPVASAKR